MAKMAADPQLVQFYNACYKDDIETVDMLMYLANKVDARETDCEHNIFKSFFGIHYACLGRAEHVLEVLLPLCYNYTTQGRVVMHFPYVSTTSNMILNEDSDILQICSISNFVEGANKILAFLQGKGKPYKHRNVCGQTVLHFASINNNETSCVLLKSRLLLPLWDAQTYGKHLSFLAYAAYLGRAQIFQFLRTQFEVADDEEKTAITVQMLYTDEGFGDLEKMAYSQLDNYEKMGTSKEEKSKTALACNFLCKKVLEYAMSNERRFKKVIKKWDAKCEKLGQKSQTEFLRRYSKLDKPAAERAQDGYNADEPKSSQIDAKYPVLAEDQIFIRQDSSEPFSKRYLDAERVIKNGIERGNKGDQENQGSDANENEGERVQRDGEGEENEGQNATENEQQTQDQVEDEEQGDKYKKKKLSWKEKNAEKRKDKQALKAEPVPNIEDEFGMI